MSHIDPSSLFSKVSLWPKVGELPPRWLRRAWPSAPPSAPPAAAWEASSAPPAKGARAQTAAPAPAEVNKTHTHTQRQLVLCQAKENQHQRFPAPHPIINTFLVKSALRHRVRLSILGNIELSIQYCSTFWQIWVGAVSTINRVCGFETGEVGKMGWGGVRTQVVTCTCTTLWHNVPLRNRVEQLCGKRLTGTAFETQLTGSVQLLQSWKKKMLRRGRRRRLCGRWGWWFHH